MLQYPGFCKLEIHALNENQNVFGIFARCIPVVLRKARLVRQLLTSDVQANSYPHRGTRGGRGGGRNPSLGFSLG